MTQKELIIYWVKQYGAIKPATMAGQIYLDVMFGSETSKRCRELRKAGTLISWRDGKFELYTLSPEYTALNPINEPQDEQSTLF